MAQTHKRATEVTLVPHAEKSAFHEWVDRYWKLGLLVAVCVTALILFMKLRSIQSTEAVQESWARLEPEVQFPGAIIGQIRTPAASEMSELAAAAADTPAGPWARLLEAHAFIDERQYDAAAAALDRLAAEYPKHPVVTRPRRFAGPESEPMTSVAALRSKIEQRRSWEGQRPHVFERPELPETAPQVRINTTKGPILVGLYRDRAPEHVGNFLKLVREGFYAGTRFHRISEDFMIQGGDPNTREGEVSTWGSGGPGYKLDPEIAPDLFHFEGMLAAAKQPGDRQSSGSGFYITTGTPHHLDGEHTIFGAVIEGAEVAREIAGAEVENGTERPVDPVTIESVEIVQE